MTRVLFADDQIPWENAKYDEKVRNEIVRELGEKLKKQGKDPKDAYESDKKWMGELIHNLRVRYGFDVTPAREYQEAERRITEREKYDIYVIDLSWHGDPNLERGKRSNVGLQLLELIATLNPTTPVIAFSQNFVNDAELMSRVLQHKAFPMQKYYTDLDYQSLAAAIKILTDSRMSLRPDGSNHVPSTSLRPDGSNSREHGRTIWDLLSPLPLSVILAFAILALVAVVGIAHINTKAGETVTALGLPLYKKSSVP